MMIDDILEKIKRGDSPSGDQLAKFTDDLLDDEACDDACRIFLALAERNITLSNVALERLCRICIDEYPPTTKEYSFKSIEAACGNNQQLPNILDDLSTALQEKLFPENQRYASKILYYYIRTQGHVTLDENLLKIMSDLLDDSVSIVQSYILMSFEDLIRNHKWEVSQYIIARMEKLLSGISTNNVQQNYLKCAYITSIFFQLSNRRYKLSESLLEIFSDFLIAEGNFLNQFKLNCCASYLLYQTIEHHLYDGHLSLNVLKKIAIFFNEISQNHKELRDYSIRILQKLSIDQLQSMEFNSTLLKKYLSDQSIEDSLKITIAHIISSQCHKDTFDKDDDTLHTLIDGLGSQVLLKDYIYALYNMIKYKHSKIKPISLCSILEVLDKTTTNNEVRQYACSIIELITKDNSRLMKYEREVLLNSLNDSDMNICNTILVIFQNFFRNFPLEEIDDDAIQGSWIERMSVLLTELLFNRDDNLSVNTCILLKLIIEKGIKQKFSEYEINNISSVLQTHPNELVREYCLNILNKIDQAQTDISPNTHDLIKLEMVTQEILRKDVLSEQDCIDLEVRFNNYLNNATFGNKLLPMNVFHIIDKMLKMNFSQSNLPLLLLQYVQNGQKLPNQLIDSIANKLFDDKNQIFIQILYHVVHNGQSVPHKNINNLIELMTANEIYSKYTILIFKLLVSRNEIQPDDKIYTSYKELLSSTRDSDLQRQIIETIAYAFQNMPIHHFPPRTGLVERIEHHFQTTTDNEIKYYSCLALCSAIDHGFNPSEATLRRLKSYAQEDNDSPNNITSKKINLCAVAINALKNYTRTRKMQENSSFDNHEIETILKQESLCRTLRENLYTDVGYGAAKKLLTDIIDGRHSLSTFNMKVLELCLTSDHTSIDLKLIVLEIFQNIPKYLQSSHIISMIALIYNPLLSDKILIIMEELIQHRVNFPDSFFQILLTFTSECEESLLRDRIIDDLETITKYNEIASDTLSLIEFEIASKKLRNSDLSIEEKSSIINQWKSFASQGRRLSKNTLQSLEHIVNHQLDDDELCTSVLATIEFATKNGQNMPPGLMKALSHLLKHGQLNKRSIINIMNTISSVNQELITQETLTNSEADLLENLSDSHSMLLKASQNGCRLSKAASNHLRNVLNTSDHTKINEVSSAIKIFQNLAITTGTLDQETVQYLEQMLHHSDADIQKSILNTLKYLSDYKPGSNLLNYLQEFFIKLPIEFNVEKLLEKFATLQIQDVLHLTHIFLTVECVQADIHDQPIHLLCRNLLCSDLILRIREHDEYDEVTQFQFYAKLIALEDYVGFSSYSFARDKVLMFLIENHSHFTLNNINEILVMLTTNRKAFYLIHTCPDDWLQQLRINWLQTVFTAYPHIKTDESTIIADDDSIKIVDLLMNKLEFSLSLSECLLQRLSYLNNAGELIAFLNSLYSKNMHNELNLWEYFTKKYENKIIAKDIYAWSFELECNLITKRFMDLCQFQNFSCSNIEDIRNIILEAYSNNWSLEIFDELFEILKKKGNEPFPSVMENFLRTFSTINNYSIKSTMTDRDGKTARSVFDLTQSNQWLSVMQKFAISVTFDQDEREKSLRDLIDEMLRTNDIETNVKLKTAIDNLENRYRDIISAYHRDSAICSIGKSINTWDEDDIKNWSTFYKMKADKSCDERSMNEVICVVKRAIYLHNKKQQYEPRMIQVLSLLLMLDASYNNIARLAQIKTGEGKSVIIAMFAAIQALNGHTVDIVTTSSLLAKRDAENKQPFFQMLNLTVGENSGNSSTKPCYKNDIVYGDVNEFQFDILRDEYSLLGTRCKRPFDIAIVDEVDSMLIDDNSKICRLSGKIPAIDELKILLTLIWQEISRLHERFVHINGKLYCVTVPFKLDDNGKIILFESKPIDPNATTVDSGFDNESIEAEADNNLSNKNNSDEQKIIEAENDNTDINNGDLIEIDDAGQFIENHLRKYVENKLMKPDENNQCLLHIPKHLNEFVKQQLSKWIWNAWQAKFFYHENIDYLITNGPDGAQSVVPIDYRNTGIIQNNTAWPDGLHQFLQIKHKLRITPESLTTNFLSNVGYFSRYNKNLFGVTGTLGSKDAQELIQLIYDVDFLIVPSYKYTQFKAFNDKLCSNEKEWLNECVKSIYEEAKVHKRAVLVISETKCDAMKIYEKLIEKETDMKNKVMLYTRSDNEEQNAINNELDCGQIIVATNLAGRGTDIRTTRAVEENGGLHVLVTFLPLNTRVEHQAFGRTARQGKRGTAQLIIRVSSDETAKAKDMASLKEDRDEQERKNIFRSKFIELERIILKDKLFENFCNLRKELRQKENDKYKLDCVEELWGFWLKNTFDEEDQSNNRSDVSYDDKFKQFRKKIEDHYGSNSLFENPFYLILKANEYIFERKKYDEAIEYLQTAIKIDSTFTVNARYYLAYALILKDDANKMQAKQELSKALEIIEDTLIQQQETMLIAFRISNTTSDGVDPVKETTDCHDAKSDIEEQVMNRINLLYLFKSQIEQAQQAIEDAKNKDHKVAVEFKKLDDFFSDASKPTLDIKELRDGGLVGFFQLTPKEPTPWFSIITVGLLGIAQAIAGAALIAFTCGAAATIGTMLLSEGIGDMITAVKSAISGEFSWNEYAIQKVVSLAITISTCGMSALKETGQAIKSGIKHGIKIVTGKTATVVGRQAVGQITKEGWKLVGKQIVIGLAKQGTKEILKTALDKTVLAELSKKINEKFTELIQEKITNEINTNETIRVSLTVDASLNRQTCQKEIEILTGKILHPQNNEFVHIAASIAKGILNKLTSDASGKVIEIVTAGKCLSELSTFLDRFLDEFRRNLNGLRETLRIDYLLHTASPTNIDEKTAREITKQLQEKSCIASDSITVVKSVDSSVFISKKHKKHEAHVIQVCNCIYKETEKKSDYAIQKSMIIKSLTNKLANHMTSRLNNELINPAVHHGVDGIVNKLSHKLEAAYVGTNDILEKKLERRRAQNFIRKQGGIMIKSGNTQQSERISSKNPSIDSEVEDLARNTETDSPGTLMDIMALSAKLGRPVVVFRNGRYDMTIGDSQSGEPLKVDYLEGEAGSIGHYGNSDTQRPIINTGPMNCLYDRLSEQTDIPSSQLRKMAADTIRQNSDHYSKMLPAARMLTKYQEKSLIYIGGTNKKSSGKVKRVVKTKNEGGVEEIVEEHDNMDLSQPENNKVQMAMEKFINSFDVDQIDVAKAKGTLLGYGIDNRFVTRPPFETKHEKNFIDSLDKKEKAIIVAPKGHGKFKPGDPRGTLRLDCQGLLKDRSINLQIQYGRDNNGKSGSYANVILPNDSNIGSERLKTLFLDSLRNRKTVRVIK